MARPAPNKPFAEAAARPDVDALENGILAFWEEEKIFEASLAQGRDKPLFTFYDGPPYATGKPHYGHVLQSALKDAVLRYKTMRGYYVPRGVGWDTHGLPVEVLVEKELGLTTKKDVERLGIAAFNQKCREVVSRYIDEFTATLKRLGRWADYAHGYATLDREYMAAEWGVFKQLWDQGLVYEAFRSTPYCVRCETPLSNFEVSMAYKDRTDPAAFVLFKVDPGRLVDDLSDANKNIFLLIWTTTPWTLPANVTVAFSPDIAYVVVEHESKEIVLAKDRVEAIFGKNAKILRDISHNELSGLDYLPPYPQAVPPSRGNPFSPVSADFVTADEGTGLVHIAPAFGVDDFALAAENLLPTLRTVDTNGKFYSDVSQWGGLSIWEANEKIIADLDQRQLLLRSEPYTHTYPFCWRCDTPLIYYALNSWFVRVSDLKERMLAANEKITWIPEHIKQGRFAKGIASAPDWAVSRNRYWSVPLPIWRCTACGETVCVGGPAELSERSGMAELTDLHRPQVDDVTWSCNQKDCAGRMQRVPEVLDVWFDSGSMPYATNTQFPADFIVESIEMTRAWFYTLHVLAVALHGTAAFKNAIGSGIIFGADGNKLSKKLKNYPEIEPTIEQYGADTVRLFFLVSTLGEPYVFSARELQHLHRNFYVTLWNVYSFFTRYANARGWCASSTPGVNDETPGVFPARGILDRWILVRLAQLERDVITAMDSYHIDQAARLFIPFVDDLSNWYVRRSRQRFQVNSERSGRGDQEAAFATLHDVLIRLSRLLAPFMPFVTEEIYRNLSGRVSVHVEQLPEPVAVTLAEEQLLAAMARTREIVSEALKLRAAAGIKVRQPLGELIVAGEELGEDLGQIICDEVNVKELRFASELPAGDFALSAPESPVRLALATTLSPALKREGLAREIIRHGQVLRREADLALDDRIRLTFRTDDGELQRAFDEYREMIMTALQADEVATRGDNETEVLIDRRPVFVCVERRQSKG